MQCRRFVALLAASLSASCTLLTGAADLGIASGTSSGGPDPAGEGGSILDDGAVVSPLDGGEDVVVSATRVKNVTFEDNSLLHPVTGVDEVGGVVAIHSTPPVVGAYSARIDVGGHVQERFNPFVETYVSVLLHFEAIAAERILYLQTQTGAMLELHTVAQDASPAYRLELRSGGSFTSAQTTVTPGQTVRVGIRYRAGNGQMTIYAAPFGQPFGNGSSVTGGAAGSAATVVDIGGRTSGGTRLVVDNLRIDSAAMPEL